MKHALISSHVLSRAKSWDASRLIKARELAGSDDAEAILSAERYLTATDNLQTLIKRAGSLYDDTMAN